MTQDNFSRFHHFFSKEKAGKIYCQRKAKCSQRRNHRQITKVNTKSAQVWTVLHALLPWTVQCPTIIDCTVLYYHRLYSVLLLMQRYSVLPYCVLPLPGEPTRSILHLSSRHGETSPTEMTIPIMTAQQSPIETMVATATSVNQSLCEVDSDADVLQNAYSSGKLS